MSRQPPWLRPLRLRRFPTQKNRRRYHKESWDFDDVEVDVDGLGDSGDDIYRSEKN